MGESGIPADSLQPDRPAVDGPIRWHDGGRPDQVVETGPVIHWSSQSSLRA